MHNSYRPMDFTKKIQLVVETTNCARHNSAEGDPCWYVIHAAGTSGLAICNFRAQKAGFNSSISDKALQRGKYGN